MSVVLQGNGSFSRGIHPPEAKELAEHAAIEVLPPVAEVNIPLLQHLGAPCTMAVDARSEVALGDVIGTSNAFISAPIHATLAGKTGKEVHVTLPNGRHVAAVPIKGGDEQLAGDALRSEIFGGEWPTDVAGYAPESITEAVKGAGIVGLGGAAFPTYVKLLRNEKKPISVLLVNGCECEPYLTADHRLMVEHPQPVITGALLAARACGAETVVVAIESNKPEAAETMRDAARGTDVQIKVVQTKYPMGGEKQTILAVVGRAVPTGGLPLDVGVVVCNVGTCAAIARAVVRHRPLTHRVMTVSGRGIATPKNILAPIGVPYRALIEFAGGLTAEAVRVIAGGPMMGFTLGDLETPVTKGTSGVTVLTAEDLATTPETACVRCGRCVDVCPLHLVPTKLAHASKFRDWDQARQYHLMACMECGCCAYACPANIPLVQYMRMGKAMLPKD